MQSQKQQNNLFPVQIIIITVMQVYALITNAKEAEVERFYEDLQDLLKVTPKKKKKDVFFIMGDWNPKAGRDTWSSRQVWPWSRNKAGQRLIELCKENSLVIANTLIQQHEMTLHMDITRWSIPRSD